MVFDGDKAAAHRYSRYGITPAQWDACPQECRVCGKEEDLVADHCHISGKFRDILCRACNRGLGFMGEDPDRIAALADYARDNC